MHCPIATHADFSQQDWDWLWRNAENDVPVELKHSVVMTYSNPNGERKNKYTLQAARCEKAAHRQKAECLPPLPMHAWSLGNSITIMEPVRWWQISISQALQSVCLAGLQIWTSIFDIVLRNMGMNECKL